MGFPRLFSLVATVAVVIVPRTRAEDATAADSTRPRFKVHGYGEMLFSHFDFGPDPRATPTGSSSDSRSVFDLARAVVIAEANLLDDLEFEAEVEIEHGGTGVALELDYEEFGEFETEIDKGGEILLEELHLTRTFSDALRVRVGHFYIPVGLTFDHHGPFGHLAVRRSEAESSLIPVLWHETGASVFGRVRRGRYWLQIVNGLDSTGFDSQRWVAGGHQQRFEEVRADGLAFAGRIDVTPASGLVIGIAGYYGDSAANRPKSDLGDSDAAVSIADVHGEWCWRELQVRGVFLRGHLQNSALVTARNRTLSNNLGVPRTPVASDAYALSVEAGYDFTGVVRPGARDRVLGFLRYDDVDSMQNTAPDIFDNPRFARRVYTAGVNLRMADRVVVKADYAMRRIGESGVEFNAENTASLGVGFQF